MSRRAALLVTAVMAIVVAGCGVEVPDDVAARAASTTTDVGAPPTTATPTSDDELEQALIDNGYTLDEARCGAANLRDQLDDDEIRSIIDAGTIEDISTSAARDFADALRPCVEDGSATDDDPGPGSDPGEGDGGSSEVGPGDGSGVPDFGDDSEGPVSRSRFLSALIVSGVPDDVARCIVDEVFASLAQDDIDLLFHAESPDTVPPDLLDAFDTIVDSCR